MRKILLIIAGAILLLGLASYCASTQVPDIANNQTLALLKEAGFNQATLPEPQIRFAAMRYDRINLDPDGLSTIKRIEIHYNPLSVLLFRSFQRVQIEGLKVLDFSRVLAGSTVPPRLYWLLDGRLLAQTAAGAPLRLRLQAGTQRLTVLDDAGRFVSRTFAVRG